MAARTPAQILSDWQAATLVSDNTADVQKGPLYSLIGKPLSEVLAPTEELADRLAQIYSLQFAQTATEEEAQAFLVNWSESAGLGAPSKTRVYFMRFSRPLSTEIITIPQGTLVSNSDQTLQFVTIETKTINGEYADTYYNPIRRTYEIAINVQAVENGPQYDLPAYRINTRVTQLSGVDAIENREASVGGVSAETTAQQITRVSEKLQGLAINTPSGEKTRIQSYNPALVKDVNVVLSSDRLLFKRITYIPGNDYYILGNDYQIITQTYTSLLGGETSISLVNVPVLSVSSVLLNNVSITGWHLETDSSLEFGRSSQAKDLLILDAPLVPNDVIEITYTYNELIQGIQKNVLSSTKLWKTNELAREFFKVYPVIELSGKALPSYDPTQVQNNVSAALQALFEPGYWQQEYLPDIVLQQLKTSVQGLTNPSFSVFQRSTHANTEIEPIVVSENEIVSYDAAYITISIRGA